VNAKRTDQARNSNGLPLVQGILVKTISFSPTNTMSHAPTATTSPSNYQLIFDNALEAYRKKTKKDLRSHPLLPKLQVCNSPDAVLTVLREQIPTFDQSHSTSATNDKLTNWLNPTVDVLYSFSEAIGAGIGLVSNKSISGWHSSRSDIRRCTGVSTRWSDLRWDRCSPLSEYLLDFIASTTQTPTPSKATKAVSTSQDALTNVFERIENFFRRLETYVEVPPTAGMTDMIVKIMIEVLSILAIATREISQGRASKVMTCMSRHCRLIVVQRNI